MFIHFWSRLWVFLGLRSEHVYLYICKKKKRHMCVLFSIIEYVYISVRGVALLDMSIDGSSYVSSSGPFILRIHFVVCFESEMSGLLLGALGHCPFHHCVRYWRDLLSYLIWADHHLFSYSMLHHHPRFTSISSFSFHPLFRSYSDLIFGFDTLFAPSLYISSWVRFFFIASSLLPCSQ